MTERLPPGLDAESMTRTVLRNGLEPNGVHIPYEQHQRSDATDGLHLSSLAGVDSTPTNRTRRPLQLPRDLMVTSGNIYLKQRETTYFYSRDDQSKARTPFAASAIHPRSSDVSEASLGSKDPDLPQNVETGTLSKKPSELASDDNQVGAEWIEQYEPGVYITLVAFRDGTRDLKRVRFSRRRFGERQAEIWWSENRGKVNERYILLGSDKPSVSAQTDRM